MNLENAGERECEEQSRQKKSAAVQRHTVIASPMSGHVLPLEQVSDEVFAEKMIGDGAAVIPEEPYVYAPGDGEITLLYPTGHAIGMKLKDGTELLIHVGIDTVKLDGAGFETLVALGQNVQKRRGDSETGSSLFECARTVNGVTGAVCQHERGTEGLAAWDGSREGGRTTV